MEVDSGGAEGLVDEVEAVTGAAEVCLAFINMFPIHFPHSPPSSAMMRQDDESETSEDNEAFV